MYEEHVVFKFILSEFEGNIRCLTLK